MVKSAIISLFLSGSIMAAMMSLHSKPTSIIGSYANATYSLPEVLLKRYFFKTRVYVGFALDIYPDSTFYYTTCGNEMKGTWQVEKDSLILDAKINEWRNDSLQRIGQEGIWPESKEFYLLIKGNRLVFKQPGERHGNKMYHYFRLKRSSD
jgi:hypothetical protein